MKIVGAKFVTSAASASQFIRTEKPMLAVCGKSNSGKSTLINLLARQKNLAKTSAQPGKTRLVNYFDFGPFLLADLPGYGYAAVSKAEKEKWGKTLDAFFASGDISHVLLLTDIRRDPSPDDLQMVEFLTYHIIPFTVVATKCDKLSRAQKKGRLRAVANAFGLGVDNVLAVSGVTGEGKDELVQRLGQVLTIGEEE